MSRRRESRPEKHLRPGLGGGFAAVGPVERMLGPGPQRSDNPRPHPIISPIAATGRRPLPPGRRLLVFRTTRWRLVEPWRQLG